MKEMIDMARILSEMLVGNIYRRFIYEAINRSDGFILSIKKINIQKEISPYNDSHMAMLKKAGLNFDEIQFDWNCENDLLKKRNQIYLYEYLPFCRQLSRYFISEVSANGTCDRRFEIETGIDELLLQPGGINNWLEPRYPEDLAFIKNNKLWFYSTTHEQNADLCLDSFDDMIIWESIGIKFLDSFDYKSDVENRICLEV